MNVQLVKLLFALLILVIGFTGASLPWYIPAMRQGGRIPALGNTFAAGVLGGAGLVHLLGAGIDGFRQIAPNLQYPLALLLAGLAFLFILLIEGVIIGKHHSDNSEYRHQGFTHEIAPARLSDISHIRAFILLIVLSIHSLILGLTLGVQQTINRVTIVFIAIIAHKLFAGFALGVSFKRDRTLKWFLTVAGFGIMAVLAVWI